MQLHCCVQVCILEHLLPVALTHLKLCEASHHRSTPCMRSGQPHYGACISSRLHMLHWMDWDRQICATKICKNTFGIVVNTQLQYFNPRQITAHISNAFQEQQPGPSQAAAFRCKSSSCASLQVLHRNKSVWWPFFTIPSSSSRASSISNFCFRCL